MPVSTPQNFNALTPARAILVNRIIWGALILGQVAFAAILYVILSQNQQAAPPAPVEQQNLLLYINVALLAAGVSGAFIARMLILRRGRGADGAIAPGAYGTGNILFWAGCEGPSFFGLIVALINHNFWPSIVCVAIALALQIVSFPRLAHIQPRDQTFKIE